MKFDELLILLPCHSLDDFPTHLKPAEAEGLLACWSAMWHPRLIAATGKIPGWRPAAALSDSLAEKLIVIPPSVESMVPSDLGARAQREGGELSAELSNGRRWWRPFWQNSTGILPRWLRLIHNW